MKFIPSAGQELIIDQQCAILRPGTWAGMGFGKTGATLTAICHQEFTDEGPTLVLAPLRVAQSTWPDEVEKWDHTRGMVVSPILGSVAERKAGLAKRADIYTMNYDNLPWLVEQFDGTTRWPFYRVVADEATRLKSHRTRQGGKRTKALAKHAHIDVKRWVNLTGTPAPNGLIDLWGQTWFQDAGARLGRTYSAFVERWFQRLNEQVKLTGGKTFDRPVIRPTAWAQQQIEDALRDICMALNPRDFFDLSEPIVKTVSVRLPAKARQLYRNMERDFYMEVAGSGIEAAHAAAKSIKLLQLASGAVYTDPDDTSKWTEVHDVKMQALESIVEEAAGMPVLVSYHWKTTLARGLKHFPKSRHLDKNPQTVRDWNAGKIPILWAHPASAGHGLSLQDGGNILVRFDHWWDLEQHDQILERIGPMRQKQSGHDRPVWVYEIVAEDTEDERVVLRHISKRSVMDLLMEALKAKGYA